MAEQQRDSVVYRQCIEGDFDSVYFIINEAARAYAGKIPTQCYGEPYMTREHFRDELAANVVFWGYEEEGALRGVMGIQRVEQVSLIRHAYVRTEYQSLGIGGRLLRFLLAKTNRPVMVGTWAGAERAVAFYQQRGFQLAPPEIKDQLLSRYWHVPSVQMIHSVVLANSSFEDIPL